MKISILFTLLMFLFSCSNHAENGKINDKETQNSSLLNNKEEFTWNGKINKKIPVFLHYRIVDELIIGELTYLNTKAKKPIKAIGRIGDDKSLRIFEFDPTGNITGILTGLPDKDHFKGKWFSPKTNKELDLDLVPKDTSLSMINVESKNIYGNYSYRYDEEGYQGDFEIKKVGNDKAEFSIVSVTGSPSRNIAEVETDTITISGNSFTYTIPESEDCEFKVKFYKDFAFVQLTKGYCASQFGHNATIEGIFFKIKNDM